MGARLMRRILVDFARARGYQKRGGSAQQVTFIQALEVAEGQATDVVARNDALEALADVIAESCRA
jgi:RNA polymerase sigma-70 factor, ECF subfamily